MKIIAFAFTLIFAQTVLNAQMMVMGSQNIANLEESPAGSKILKYFNSMNSDVQLDEAWVKQLFSKSSIEKIGVNRIIEMSNNIREMEGEMVVYEVERVDMLEYKVKAMGKASNNWLDLGFTFQDGNPYPITGIDIEVTDQASAKEKPLFGGN